MYLLLLTYLPLLTITLFEVGGDGKDDLYCVIYASICFFSQVQQAVAQAAAQQLQQLQARAGAAAAPPTTGKTHTASPTSSMYV